MTAKTEKTASRAGLWFMLQALVAVVFSVGIVLVAWLDIDLTPGDKPITEPKSTEIARPDAIPEPEAPVSEPRTAPVPVESLPPIGSAMTPRRAKRLLDEVQEQIAKSTRSVPHSSRWKPCRGTATRRPIPPIC